MMKQLKRKMQCLAGVSVSLAFMFTGAALSWPSPALPKLKNGDANVVLSDVSIDQQSQLSWVAALTAIGALPGCFISQVLAEKLGRRRTIYASAVPGLFGASIILFTSIPWLLYIARLLEGLTTGMVAVVGMIYITEIADKEIRGPLGMLVQVMNNAGSLLMYCIGPFVSYTTLNCLILSIPVVYVTVCLWLPESPYYHLKDGRVAEARQEFIILKHSKDEKWVDEQLGLIRAHVRESMENKTTIKELLTNLMYRKPLYIIAGLKFLQYMTGALAIQSYLEMIFRQSSSVSGPVASIIYGFVQLGAGLMATFLAGYIGRRVLLLVSSLGVAASLTAVGTYFFLQDYMHTNPETLTRISSLPLIGILGFNVLYAVGIGNIPYVMQAELFPMNVKAVASSLATISACIFSFTVAKGYQGVKDVFGHYTVFWMFAAVAYAGLFFIYYLVPETKGKSLEEIHDSFYKKAMDEAQGLRERVTEVES